MILEIDNIIRSIKDIHRNLFLLDGRADTEKQAGYVRQCREAITDMENGALFDMLKSFEG